MKFSSLNVFQGQNRNSTATFEIFGYNTADGIDTWMVPGIAVFVVNEGLLRFSGVISTVDGSYVGNDQKQIFKVSCESDANWLINRTPLTYNGTKCVQYTANAILYRILDPYQNFFNGGLDTDSTQLMDYTISDKPMLTQIQEVATTNGMKYRARTKASTGTISWAGDGGSSFIYSLKGDPITENLNPSTIGWGSHNKWILVKVSGSGVFSHNVACALTSSYYPAWVVATSTNAINFYNFASGDVVIVIQHPVIGIKPNFQRATGKRFYANPTSSIYSTVCNQFSPLSDKNDIITKVTADGQDTDGKRISTSMAASFAYNPTIKEFLLQTTLTTVPKLTVCYDSTIADISGQHIYVYSDTGITWIVGTRVHVLHVADSSQFVFITAQADVGPAMNGRPTTVLGIASPPSFVGLSIGDIVTTGGSTGGARFFPDSVGALQVGGYYWLGGEMIHVTYISSGTSPVYFDATRGYRFYSVKGYYSPLFACCHTKGCPILDARPLAGFQNCYDADDYYVGTYPSPVSTIGINAKKITVNKVVSEGTLEVICYNVLKNRCIALEKGDLKTLISCLTYPGDPYNVLLPGDQFQVDYFGTLHPTFNFYEIVSMDMNFDQNSCKLTFGEYELGLMQSLSQMGLSINIT